MKIHRGEKMRKKQFIFLTGCLLMLLSWLETSMEVQAVVNPNQTYSYNQMVKDLEALKRTYPDQMTYHSIGQSAYGREIYAVKIGRGEQTIHLNGSHHAREWMTSSLLMEMIDVYLMFDRYEYNLKGYDVHDLLDEVSIWFVPMLNPDGVTLQQQGLTAFPSSTHAPLIKMNYGSGDFTRWKANAEGIDLNRQYPMLWEEVEHSPKSPAYMNFKGTAPLQASEARALYDFTNEIKPDVTLAYHSSGEIIFWHFNQPDAQAKTDKVYADLVSNITGYGLVKPNVQTSGSGYKDWFVTEHNKPGLTVEVSPSVGERHVPLWRFPSIWDKNKHVPLAVMTQVIKDRPITVESFERKITFIDQVALYTEPQSSKMTTMQLAPQSIYVTNKIGDFFEVNTWLGTRYIKPTTWYDGVPTAVDAKYYLTKTTSLYNQPVQSKSYAVISPQHVKVNKQLGDWLNINTWLGPKWIKATEVIQAEKVTIEEKITLSETTPFYQDLTMETKVGQLGAQTVQAIEQVGNYYKINTYLGDYWIYVTK